jgi:hypothetical protein
MFSGMVEMARVESSEDETERFLAAYAGDRLPLIAESFARLVGRPLLSGAAGASALWAAPLAVLAHGTEADPVFFYGNRLALELFETGAEALVQTPSRLSAEAGAQAGRARLLEQVSRHGFIQGYEGVRISAAGRRFRIEGATIWNLIDAAGALHGQAAAFAHWTRLD